MSDQPLRAADELIRRVERGAADQPDSLHILAQMINMIDDGDVGPNAVLSVSMEGAARDV